jgi:hypothetical protein
MAGSEAEFEFESELDEESVLRARRLSSRLTDDLRMISEKGPPGEFRRERFSEQRFVEEAEGTPIKDVLANVEQMAVEFVTARRLDNRVLCLRLDDAELAPISLGAYLPGASQPTLDPNEWFELWESYFPFPYLAHWREILFRSAQREENIVVSSVGEAVESVERSLKRFLSYRFAGMRKWGEWIHGIGNQFLGGSTAPPQGGGTHGGGFSPPPAVGQGGGLQVQVSCRTPGLRIHVAPAFFINWVFFGSPTTPVTSYVLPGRYVFAGDGPMLPRLTKDGGTFCIPPTYYPVLTRF